MTTIAVGTKIWGSTQYIAYDDGSGGFNLTPYVEIKELNKNQNNEKVKITYTWFVKYGTKDFEVPSGTGMRLQTNKNSFIINPGGGLSKAIDKTDGRYAVIEIATATFEIDQGEDLSNVTFINTWQGGGSSAGSGQAWGAKFATPEGFIGAGYTVPIYYTAPSEFNIIITNKNTTSATVKATWVEGTEDSIATITINGKTGIVTSSGGTTTISGLTPNTSYIVSGSLSDGTTTLSASISTLTNIAIPSDWTKITSNTGSITIIATSSNGGNFKYQYRIKIGSSWTDNWQDSGIFSSLSSNTNYLVEARCVNTDNTSIVSGSLSGSVWTYPVINNPIVTLKSGSEHNTINVSVSASVSAGSYDQFTYAIDNNSWLPYDIDKTHSFTGLSGNTSYKIWVKMKNTNSGFESDSKFINITTWHNPLTALKVNLVNRWFWYLAINCSYTYTGTISKYEFAIGNEKWIDTKKENFYAKGTTSPTGLEKLNYNTEYNCWVRVTDNHGRTYGFSDTTYTFTNAKLPFKTLDERVIYINDKLSEVKVIKPDNSMIYITPNLLTVIKPNNQSVNMNKIINNDDRETFI